MDDLRLDTLARHVGAARSRRSAIRAMATAGLGLSLLWLGQDDRAAGKGTKKKGTASCLKVSLTQTDGGPLMAVRAGVSSRDETYTLHLSTRQPVNEPAAVLHVAASCGTGIQRSYQLLLDPVVILPQLAQAPQAGSTRVAGKGAATAPISECPSRRT